MFAGVRFLPILLLICACEGDAAKLQRLHSEQDEQCLLARRYEQNGDSSLRDAPIRCKLAGERLEEFIARH